MRCLETKSSASNCRKLIALAWGLFITCLHGFDQSQFAPFFPNEAELHKNLSKTQIGLVFASAEVSSIVTCLFVTDKISNPILKTAATVAIFISSFSALLFGCVAYVTNPWLFFTGCVASRILGGATHTIHWVAFITLAVSWFPQHQSRLAGSVESIFAVGFVIGPGLGSVLFSWGGYAVPFISCGLVKFITACFTWFVLLDYHKKDSIKTDINSVELDENGQSCDIGKCPKSEQSIRMWDVLLSWKLHLISLPTFTVATSYGLMQIFLTPFLRIYFSRDESVAAVFFMFYAAIPMISFPFIGHFVDKGFHKTPRICGPVIGILAIIIFVLSAETEMFGHEQVVFLATCLHSASFSICVIINISDVVESVNQMENPAEWSSASTNRRVALAWFQFVWKLGTCLGSASNGFILQYLGFEEALYLNMLWLSTGLLAALAKTFLLQI